MYTHYKDTKATHKLRHQENKFHVKITLADRLYKAPNRRFYEGFCTHFVMKIFLRNLVRTRSTAVHVMQCLGQLDTPLKKNFHAWIHIATAHPVFLLPYYGLCKRSIAMCVS